MSYGIDAIGDLIVLKGQRKETKTESGIIIPATAKDDRSKLVNAEVVAKGELVSERIEVGKRLLFPFYAGNQFEYEGMIFTTIKADKVLAIVI